MTTPNPPQMPSPHSRPSPALLLFLIFPLLGIIAALAMALANPGPAAVTPPTPLPVAPQQLSLVDKPAPNFELKGLDGRSYRLSSYRGRVVFVNFWATWCEPCRRELPAFEQFAAAQGADGAAILAVNIGETPDQVAAFFEQYGVKALPVLLDDTLDVYGAYGIERLPTTFVLDPAGTVRYKHLGEITAADLEAYVARLRS